MLSVGYNTKTIFKIIKDIILLQACKLANILSFLITKYYSKRIEPQKSNYPKGGTTKRGSSELYHAYLLVFDTICT